ncbi:hypothetical protein ACFLYA_02395 [Candidatus Dependentiae bacterium]
MKKIRIIFKTMIIVQSLLAISSLLAMDNASWNSTWTKNFFNKIDKEPKDLKINKNYKLDITDIKNNKTIINSTEDLLGRINNIGKAWYPVDQVKGELKPWEIHYKRVRKDLIIVQLFVPLQKYYDDPENEGQTVGHCWANALHYSSLFAQEPSPTYFLKTIWEDTWNTEKEIDAIVETYQKKQRVRHFSWRKIFFQANNKRWHI